MKITVFLLLCETFLVACDYGVPQYLKTKYGNSAQFQTLAPPDSKDPSYSKTKHSPSSADNSPDPGIKSGVKTNNVVQEPPTSKYRGGCNKPPPAPLNAGVRCSKYNGCRADCVPYFKFPNGATQIKILCTNGEWNIAGGEFDSVPSCQPICEPACQNNGICVTPGKCDCPENFSGPLCQYENTPCLNYPKLPLNSRRTCKSKTCTVTCLANHQFPDGSEIATLSCTNGDWLPSKTKWTSLPDCQPICNPECQNGGICLSFNTCQCGQDYRGPQCQYRADKCSVKQMNFNGGYDCKGDADTFNCSLSCPDGVPFEFPPDEMYSCEYRFGIFLPVPIPQCIFPPNINILPGGGSSHSYYKIINNSSYDYDRISANSLGQVPEEEDVYYGVRVPVILQTIAPDTNVETNHLSLIPVFKNDEDRIVFPELLPKPGICLTWQGQHYKTFDGKVFSHDTKCPYTLLTDRVDNTFSIIVGNRGESIKIYYLDRIYELEKSEKGDFPVFRSANKTLPIPGQVAGIRIELVAHQVVVFLDSIGAKLQWDGKNFIQVDVTESLWNRTDGLCGQFDGNAGNDVTTPALFRVPTPQEECYDPAPLGQPSCQENFCQNMFQDERFAPCHRAIDFTHFLEACRTDYCNCGEKCACDTVDVYVKACTHKGFKEIAAWRDENTCPMQCTGGRLYFPCGPPQGQPTCSSLPTSSLDLQECIEGCYCPTGTVLHQNRCILKESCPCRHRAKDFPPGAQIPKECNTCTCRDGQWACTENKCGARCSAVGDPHYTTFDGKSYDFMGHCSYFLVKRDDFAIEGENVACAGSISKAMNLPVGLSQGLPSCTKTVTVRMQGHVVKLKQGLEVTVDGSDIDRIPYRIAGMELRSVSSIFLQLELPNGVVIWWDGLTRVYIDVPANFTDTYGLCGTFTQSQNDDFVTPERDVEQSVINFANKWKTDERCSDIPDKAASHPCSTNPGNKAKAQKLCGVLKSRLFEECHFCVDPEKYYQDCLYDLCACEYAVDRCLCPTISAYADECTRKGVKIDWRPQVRQCGLQCPAGQHYQICGNSCTRTCHDISHRPHCTPECVEGCNCPEGQTLDAQNQCVPIGQCPCHHETLDFQPNYKEIRPASKGLELCTCMNGRWFCRHALRSEVDKYPKAEDLKSLCKKANMEFTTCEPAEPKTCKNMHDAGAQFTPVVCHAGCKCKEGFVVDGSSKECVRPVECPCHHGGRSYKENETVRNECNTCVCNHGKWSCTTRTCSGQCLAWGESHFKTFDSKHYDYQGQCDYVLAKGSKDAHSFDITIQNVPCGTLGTACSKSLTIRVNSNSEHDTLTLSKEKPLPTKNTSLRHLQIRRIGLFVIVEEPDLGIAVHWDRGTRVYVRLGADWKGHVSGLCGNYNGNQEDDFQTPSGGMTEASPLIFGDSWKLQPYCPEAKEVTNTCESNPERKVWALKQCGVLKSSLFAVCHSEVPIDRYLEKCIFDSCACDQGGDCHCFCTAIAVYAQECNNRGIPIKWRSQDLCPIQCDESCTNYNPCISACSPESCDDVLTLTNQKDCNNYDTCVEGCAPKSCPEGSIYLNSSKYECVPKKSCKPQCVELDGIVFYEGDAMESDECHSCFCSLGQKVCKGLPCTTSTRIGTPSTSTTKVPLLMSTRPQNEQLVNCKTGWTDWFNQDQDKVSSDEKPSDFEPLPDGLLMNVANKGRCNKDQITNIECRSARNKTKSKETGLNVQCSLEKGLICETYQHQKCVDFEIRVYCQCEIATTVKSTSDQCDSSRPHQEHPDNCEQFYHCDNGHLVLKTCGPSMFYNPTTMTCDWPHAVQQIKPSCNKTPEECPPGQIFNQCAVVCDNLCLYYSQQLKQMGKCKKQGQKCDAGCTEKETIKCTNGFWANNETCVDKSDCVCVSDEGYPVKPGQVYKESGCKTCQCIDNFYACDESACFTTTPEPESEKEQRKLEEVPIASTVTPPEPCYNYKELLKDLPNENFHATSVLSDFFRPHFSKLHNTFSSWSSQENDRAQFLELDLGQLEPVYGIKIKGSPLYDEYVTSFKVFYSYDGTNFLPVVNKHNLAQIFRGNLDPTIEVEHIFETPFEAQIVKINPQTWHNGISLRVEILGCGQEFSTMSTTPLYEFLTIAEELPQCDDSMGLNNGQMSLQQITVSSELDGQHGKKYLNIDQEYPWQPVTNSQTEFIKFDLLEPRNLTGLLTKGGPKGWVTAYTIQYSHDDTNWNPILEPSQSEQIFPGNFDTDSLHQNNFQRPLCTRYIKISPVKWYQNIQMRAEILGCFQPYPTILEEPTTLPSIPCDYCPGVEANTELQACPCGLGQWFDGTNCVPRTECPCFVNDLQYNVGTTFKKEDCSECLCKMGGVEHCTPKKCPSCGGLQSILTKNCKCTCEPCNNGTVYCPTSNICIEASLWCNGIQDCPDDELHCAKEVTTVAPVALECPRVTCPKGYKSELKQTAEPIFVSSVFNSNYAPKTPPAKMQNKGKKTLGKPEKKYKLPVAQQPVDEVEICPELRCISEKPPQKYEHGKKECPPVFCPLDYIPVFVNNEESEKLECPKYTCNAQPAPDSICNVTGNIFNTFDGTEYKYEVCGHILMRDMTENALWDVSLKKTCEKTCHRSLTIRQNEDEQLTMHQNLTIEYNNYRYTVNQIKRIASKSQTFTLSHLGNTLLFVSNPHGFWIVWDKNGNVKLGVVDKLKGKIDGLCGFFNGKRQDDKRRPDGSAAKNTQVFGDSWATQNQDQCKEEVCTRGKEALDICDQVKDQVLAVCANFVDLDAFISRCVATTCNCFEGSTSEECRCNILQDFVVQCLSAEPKTDLANWRTQLNCPVSCEAPLVYHDCYQRQCELSCEDLSTSSSSCPLLPKMCFPGCYCPPGHVRKDNTCIKPSECRDCECNLLPHLKYATYDHSNFTVSGSCVYVMSRDLEQNFQLLITNAPCKNDPDKMCIGKITILYKGHKIHIFVDLLRQNLRMIVDGELVGDFAALPWLHVTETHAKHLRILLVAEQVEISIYHPSLGVSIKTPSNRYAGKLEGLCGDCNKNPEDDFRTPQGLKPSSVDEFGLSWLYDKLPGGQNPKDCSNQPEPECELHDQTSDPCTKFLEPAFAQCLPIVDPALFMEWCQKDTCKGGKESACVALEAYASECASAGFCLDWRGDFCPKQCPPERVYKPCGVKCERTCQNLGQELKGPGCEGFSEGCFCPEGLVLTNDTCVEAKDCLVCDEEGHHSGDVWKRDRCTKCSCVGTELKCQTQSCSETICDKGYQAVKIPMGRSDECCEKYTCVLDKSVCEAPQQLVCGPNQITKLDTKPNGCQQFICECKPKSECEPLNPGSQILDDGFTEEIDDRGCCPELKLICKPETCKKPAKCPLYHTLEVQKTQDKCCPLHVCQPPQNQCIYEVKSTGNSVLKDANETWKDGACRECKCELSDLGNYQSICSTIDCPPMELAQDYLDYNLEPEYWETQCCPKYKRTACKFQDTLYKIGDKWFKNNPCTSFKCVNASGIVEKHTEITDCDKNCELGFEYVHNPDPKICCGSCKPYACVVDGILHKTGEEWTSEDHCKRFFCLNVNNSLQVQSVVEHCPELPQDYSENYIFDTVSLPKQCCKEHRITACRSDGITIAINETIQDPTDKCKKISCKSANGQTIKKESVETCKTECMPGWQYQNAIEKDKCCGDCVQIGCMVNMELKKPAEQWLAQDNCTTFTCEQLGQQFIVSSQQESCPSLEDCPKENVYKKGCCQYCNITSKAQAMCTPVSVAKSKTIGIIKLFQIAHGQCVNKSPIESLTECVGSCKSSTFFNFVTGLHENQCSCCRALKYETLEVELECEDGFKWLKKLSVPSECSCESCDATK